MPILSIISEPATNALYAAYRPILFRVQATATGGAAKPPVVYCDVYINGRYYKTISRTVESENLGSSTAWQFDVQDAAQEFLGKYMAPNGGTEAKRALPVLIKIFCRFRSSGIDTNGFIAPEDTAPIQGTASSSSVAGSGFESTTFYVLNATIQHSSNPLLNEHLDAYKTGVWKDNCYPATHRPGTYMVALGQSDYYPILLGEGVCQNNLLLRFKYIGQNEIRQLTESIAEPCTALMQTLEAFIDSVNFDVNIVWSATGNYELFEYTLDGGDPVLTDGNSVLFTGLAEGPHEFTIRPLCACGAGALETLNFTI